MAIHLEEAKGESGTYRAGEACPAGGKEAGYALHASASSLASTSGSSTDRNLLPWDITSMACSRFVSEACLVTWSMKDGVVLKSQEDVKEDETLGIPNSLRREHNFRRYRMDGRICTPISFQRVQPEGSTMRTGRFHPATSPSKDALQGKSGGAYVYGTSSTNCFLTERVFGSGA